MTVDEMVEKIAYEISGWSDGYEMRASFANDGNGHFDFMGFTVKDDGKAALRKLLSEMIASE